MSRNNPTVRRRGVIAAGAGVAAASTFPAPAISQGRMEWRMVTSWPMNLPGPGVSANRVAERIGVLSNGRLTVKVFGAGQLVPALGVFDAVSAGTAEIYHAVPAYWLSKSRGIGFFGSFPYGMVAQELQAWMNFGGGNALYDEIYGRFGVKPFMCGDSGPQWMGWFRREIKSIDDFRGLRFRTAGLGSQMFRKAGASVVTLPGGEIFAALQAGTIDAAEFIGPWNDANFGFHQVAKFYYYPGVQEPSSSEEIGVNKAKFDALPKDLQQVVQFAAQSSYVESLVEYDEKHPKALVDLVGKHGVQLREAPRDLLVAFGNAAGELLAEIREDADPMVKRIAESYVAFRKLQVDYTKTAYQGVMNARALPIKWG
ncbi:MAG: TRAP transporter substrate-binding protein [Alphaproteobacteria bacterium]|nr:TRAP transporter substrate-binding protein [Alphaproteobacteria bacterium]